MQRGFIALISVLVISVALMSVLLAASTAGIFARQDALDSEFAQNAKGLAEGCVDAALLQLSEDYNFTQTASSLNVGQDTCDSVSVQTTTATATQRQVQIVANVHYQHTYAHLEVKATVQTSTPLIVVN